MVDRAVFIPGMDHRVSNCHERHPELWKGKHFALIPSHDFNPQLHIIIIITITIIIAIRNARKPLTLDVCLLEGGVFHIDVPVHGANDILCKRDNVRRCSSGSGTHVHTGHGQIITADCVAGCGHTGILFIWAGIWLIDRIRQLQHPEEQLCTRCSAGFIL